MVFPESECMNVPTLQPNFQWDFGIYKTKGLSYFCVFVVYFTHPTLNSFAISQTHVLIHEFYTTTLNTDFLHQNKHSQAPLQRILCKYAPSCAHKANSSVSSENYKEVKIDSVPSNPQ
jgi:hypothetical protein